MHQLIADLFDRPEIPRHKVRIRLVHFAQAGALRLLREIIQGVRHGIEHANLGRYGQLPEFQNQLLSVVAFFHCFSRIAAHEKEIEKEMNRR